MYFYTRRKQKDIMHRPKLRPIHSIADILIILTAVVSLTCCHPSNTYDTDHGVPSCDLTEALDSIMAEIFPGEEPGGICAVMVDGNIVYDHGFGLMDLRTRELITDSTMFNLSSASKLFTAVAMLKLQEEGKLSLDDSLSKYFPEFKGQFFDKITIRHLLTHSSGLPDLRPRNDEEWKRYVKSHKSLFVIGDDYRLYGREEEHMKVFQNLDELEYEPGSHYQRQDPSYILIAPLIERVTNTEFDTWMNENIFKPAGMKDVFYYKPDFKMHKMAHAYRPVKDTNDNLSIFDQNTYRSDDGKWEEYDYGEVPFFLTKADRGVYATVKDFMRWNKELYDGKIISDSSLKTMQIGYIPTDVPLVSFGLGTAIRNEPNRPPKLYHLNSNGGFSIIEATWPSERIHYVIFANRADWNQRATANAIDSLLYAKGYIEKTEK